MDFITKALTRNSNKNYKGLSNELLISGNLHKAGYTGTNNKVRNRIH